MWRNELKTFQKQHGKDVWENQEAKGLKTEIPDEERIKQGKKARVNKNNCFKDHPSQKCQLCTQATVIQLAYVTQMET